jgi:hypothetical protein
MPNIGAIAKNFQPKIHDLSSQKAWTKLDDSHIKKVILFIFFKKGHFLNLSVNKMQALSNPSREVCTVIQDHYRITGGVFLLL